MIPKERGPNNMFSINEIEAAIIEAVKEVSGGYQVTDKDMHLLDDSIPMPIVNYLYVFDMLEKKLDLPVVKVLEANDYTVFTVRNLAREISKLQA